MDTTQIVGIAAGVLTAVSMLPQLIKIVKEKKAEDVSIIMLVILNTGLILWTVYGLMRNDMPIIVTNCFSILVNITLLVLRIKYSGTKEVSSGSVQPEHA
jgi:MtN3 and saliva related transmembrane protein